MTKTEISQALSLVRDTAIQAKVQINNTLTQVEFLMAKIQEDIEKEPEK